jgi:hypothetical protein
MIYEIRTMSFGELLDAGFRLLRNQVVVLVGLAAVLYVPLVFFHDGIESAVSPIEPTSPGEVAGVLGMVTSGLLLGLLWLMVVVPVSSAAITHAVSELYLGRQATIGSALRVGWGMFVPLAGTMLLMSVLVLGGLLLFVVPGIYLMLCYSLAWPVMVIERQFGMAALQRSRDLTRGSLLRVVGLAFVVGIFVSVIGGGLQLLLGYLPLVGPLASGVVQAIGAAFQSAFLVLLYFDIRCRKEAFDLEHLARLVEGGRETPMVATPAS